jgi:hypothetical protein
MTGKKFSKHCVQSSTRKMLLRLTCGQNQANLLSSVKLPKSFVAINLSEKVPDAFEEQQGSDKGRNMNDKESPDGLQSIIPLDTLDG